MSQSPSVTQSLAVASVCRCLTFLPRAARLTASPRNEKRCPQWTDSRESMQEPPAARAVSVNAAPRFEKDSLVPHREEISK